MASKRGADGQRPPAPDPSDAPPKATPERPAGSAAARERVTLHPPSATRLSLRSAATRLERVADADPGAHAVAAGDAPACPGPADHEGAAAEAPAPGATAPRDAAVVDHPGAPTTAPPAAAPAPAPSGSTRKTPLAEFG